MNYIHRVNGESSSQYLIPKHKMYVFHSLKLRYEFIDLFLDPIINEFMIVH